MGVRGDASIWEAEDFGIELVSMTIGELLDRRADSIPAKEALAYRYPEQGIELRLTYSAYRALVNGLAKGLLALGIERHDHVAVWAPNLPEWPLLQLALAKIGAVMIAINTAYRAAELEYVLEHGDVTALFLASRFKGNSYLDSIYSIAPELRDIQDPAVDLLGSTRLPRLKRVVAIDQEEHPGLLNLADVIKQGQGVSDPELADRQSCVKPDDVVMIQYTSGTTGFPKAVMLTHSNMLNQAHLSCCRGNFGPDERQVSAMPFFHVAGCIGGILISLYSGSTLIPLISFDAAKQLELLESERGTFTFCVPTMLIAMLNHPRYLAGEFDLASLRQIMTEAAPIPIVLIEEIKQRMGADCLICYGMTETSGSVTCTLPPDTFELKSSTVGIPMPHMDIKIADPVTGEPKALGETGELMARGHLVMKGYYNPPDKMSESIDSEGWMHTGDLATMNPQGYVNIVGRAKDMIIRGGENLYPAEIEAFLMRHPKVAEAQVVGVPDTFMGEEAAALIRLKPDCPTDETEIREYCLEGISRFKAPKYIRFVDAYPLTASGKVKKYELRQQIVTELSKS